MIDTRARILHVALQLFANAGYDGVGVQTIVEAAGITKPTLYHYFGSKQGLFDTLVDEQGRALLTHIRDASVYNGDITQCIRNVVQAYFEYADEHPTFYRMMLSMWFAPPSSEYFSSIQNLLYQQHLVLEELFRLAAQDHGNMLGRQQQYAISLKGMIDTYIGVGFRQLLDLHSSEFQQRVIHQFMHGIFS